MAVLFLTFTMFKSGSAVWLIAVVLFTLSLSLIGKSGKKPPVNATKTAQAPAVPVNAAETVQPVPAAPATTENAAETGETPAAPALPQTFKGEHVAFTGKLPSMTRDQAIEAVRARGGQAYKSVPVRTTILVVGDKPGMGKLDLADERLGQLRKITAAQFVAMLAAA